MHLVEAYILHQGLNHSIYFQLEVMILRAKRGLKVRF